MLNKLNKLLGRYAFNANRAEFYDDLSSAISANISFDKFLKTSQEYAVRLKLSTAVVYPLIRERFESTQSLSGALTGVVPENDKMILSASERSGSIEQGLRFLVKSIGFVEEMRSAIADAIIMPIGLFIGLALLLVGISLYGVPAMTELLPPEKWQGGGQTLLWLSGAVKNYGVLLVAAVAGCVYFFIWSLGHWTGPTRAKLDQRFPYSFYSSYHGAMLLVSLLALNRGGVSVMYSLNHLLVSASPWMRWHLKKIIRSIQQRPDAFAESFNSGLYSSRVVFRMALASSSGAVEDKLEGIAETSMKETLKDLKRTSAFVNKVMLAAFGVSLLYVVATFMLTAQNVGMQAGRAG